MKSEEVLKEEIIQPSLFNLNNIQTKLFSN